MRFTVIKTISKNEAVIIAEQRTENDLTRLANYYYGHNDYVKESYVVRDNKFGGHYPLDTWRTIE